MSGRSTPRPRAVDPAAVLSPHLSFATAANLPPELVLDILGIEITATRDHDAGWARQTMLVSRAVRTYCLSRLYEVLFINVRSGWRSTTYKGWDGRRYRTRRLGFLSYLLHNPQAPPRRYVRHLVFNKDVQFKGVELTAGSYSPGWGTPIGEAGAAVAGGNLWPSLWTVPRLTVRDSSNVPTLMAAGLNSPQIFAQDWTRRVHPMLGETTSWPAAARWALERSAGLNLSRAIFRCFPQQEVNASRNTWESDDESDWGRPVRNLASECVAVMHGQLYGARHPGLAQINELPEGTLFFLIELGNAGAMSASVLQSSIAEILLDRSLTRLRIVLVCEHTFRIEGMSVRELLIKTQGYGLSRSDLVRIRISHQPWRNLDVLQLEPALTLAREIQKTNPWDMGYRLDAENMYII